MSALPELPEPEDTLTMYPDWHGPVSTSTLLAGTWRPPPYRDISESDLQRWRANLLDAGVSIVTGGDAKPGDLSFNHVAAGNAVLAAIAASDAPCCRLLAVQVQREGNRLPELTGALTAQYTRVHVR